MTKALPHPAEPLHDDPFPFLELRRLGRTHLWRGLALAAALHASLIAVSLPRLREPAVAGHPFDVTIGPWHTSPPPILPEVRPREGGPAPRPEVQAVVPRNAVVEPVSMETADPDLTMAILPPDDGAVEGPGTGERTGSRFPEGVVPPWEGVLEEPLPDPGEYIPFEEPPRLVSPLIPVYPRIALEAGVEGTVSLLAFIGKDGSVKEVRIESGIPMLDDAAIAAVRAARFRPALQNREPVGVWIRIPVRFRLRP